MRTASALTLAFTLFTVAAQEGAKKGAPKMGGKLWAGLTANKALFITQEGGPKDFLLEFAVVNDGDAVVNPELEQSQLIVNGKELDTWPFTIANGLRDARWTSLGPGQQLRFVYAMKEHFAEPGIYTVSWKGKSFETREVVFRVLKE